MMLARLAPLLVLRSVRAMSKTVILVRHGAVDRAGGGVKPDGLYGGDVDVPLSARGEAEARAAAAACGVAAVEEREAFRVKRGAWVGRTLAEVSARSRDMRRFLGDYDFRPAGGASR
ncbi:Histidine phosphatase [Aureococcus anophagefferens]|nr:Histidine phosphatase [Aureococcus anophagefferens]